MLDHCVWVAESKDLLFTTNRKFGGSRPAPYSATASQRARRRASKSGPRPTCCGTVATHFLKGGTDLRASSGAPGARTQGESSDSMPPTILIIMAHYPREFSGCGRRF